MTLLPLIVAVPLLAATAIGLAGHWLRPRLVDAIAALAAAGAAVLAAIVLARSSQHVLVYWFGGWRPAAGHFPLGVAFVVDPLGAGLALLALVLATGVIVYSWHYLSEAHHLFEVLVLLFAAGTAGFALSGDLFNMFVFFELMSVSAYALTAYRVEDQSALQSAFNFAVSNSVGSFLLVLGIALVYARTGALNLAEIGHRLAGRHDGLVIVAFTLVVCGFLVKAAIVPFHFWLADAYAAAPAPVCVLFAGVMSDVGIYAIARIYWTVFDAPFAAFHDAVRDVLLGFGAATAVVGAVMCVLQRHLKRLLAYATISELGVLLIGVALLTPGGAAGTALTMLAHGLGKSALFLVCGILLVTRGGIDELQLYGRCRRLYAAGAAWVLAALALSGGPFLGTFTGHALLDDSASGSGLWWLPAIVAVATILTTGTILRAGARVFLGVGEREDPLLQEEPTESAGPHEDPSLPAMTAVTLVLAVAALAAGAWTGLAAGVDGAARGFVDRAGYTAAVLDGRLVPSGGGGEWRTTTASVVWAVVTLVGSFVWAVVGLYRKRLPGAVTAAVVRAATPLKAAHSGHIGDYVAWLTFGTALAGGLFALAIR